MMADNPGEFRQASNAIDVSALLRPAVYLLWRQGRVVYVGKSKVPLVRIYTHRSLARQKALPWIKVKGIVFDRVEIVPTRIEELDTVERGLIGLMAPIHNVQHNSSPESRVVSLVELLGIKAKAKVNVERRI